VQDYLKNPVYHALTSGDRSLSQGTKMVKYFDEAVSPFAGFEEGYDRGFEELHDLLPAKRKILFATGQDISEPKEWSLLQKIKGWQMIFEKSGSLNGDYSQIVPLTNKHIEEMVQLAMLTKPGPFGPKTILFGNYFGIIDQEKLVAMAGERLHLQHYTEISAVCTHPDHLGKGYGAALMQYHIRRILEQDKKPFLHVRADNLRAIGLYERLGFTISGNMNFYFLERI
jgi:ribosomal protein S18 acetylase RimI-like enzyme